MEDGGWKMEDGRWRMEKTSARTDPVGTDLPIKKKNRRFRGLGDP